MSTAHTKHLLAIYALAIICLASPSVQAQTLPGSADPSRLQQRYSDRIGQPAPEIIQPERVNVDSNIPFAPNGFLLNGIKLEGISAFSDNHFEHLVKEYTGHTVDLGTLNHLAARITQEYRNSGFFLSRAVIPQQTVTDGIVSLQIIEGYVNNVYFEDPDNLLSKDTLYIFQDTVNKIHRLAPLHGPTLERYLLLLNDAYGIYVQSVLAAPQNASRAGAIDIKLIIKPVSSSLHLGYNNFGSRYVGPHQLTVDWTGGGFFNAMDTMILQASTAIPMSEVQFVAMNYALPLTADGLEARFSASYSNSEPGYSLKALEVEGDSTAVEFGFAYPLVRSRRTTFEIASGFKIQNTATEFLDEELIDDKLRILSLSADLRVQDNWKGYNSFVARINKGLNIFGPTETGTAKLSRAQGRSDFVSATIEAQRMQELPAAFQLLASFSGQYSPDPLLSSQEFGYGGISFGRAYDPSEITGDKGAAGGLEVRYAGIDTVDHLHLKLAPFVFYDIGKVWNQDSGTKPISGASAGFGTYYNFNDRVEGSLQFAYPLTKTVSTPVMNGSTGPRMLFKLSTNF